MDTIIKQIMKNVMDSMMKITTKALEGEMNIFEAVEEIKNTTDAVGLDMLKATLENVDSVLKSSAQRKKEFHIQRNEDKRELVTIFGIVEFNRTYYKHKENKNHVYLLDEMVGLQKYERIDPFCKAKIIENSLDMSYAKSVKHVTPVPVSRQSVKNAIREIGQIPNDTLPVKQEKKVVEKLYIEADEDHVAMQDGTNKIMKLIYVYEGAIQKSKNRRELINKRYFTGNLSPDDLWLEVADYLYEAYELEKIDNIYIAGDGASWIKTGLGYIPGSKFVLDHFHLSKYVKKATAHLDYLRDPLWQKKKKKDKKTALGLIQIAIESTDSDSKTESIKNVKKYIRNNWIGIENLFKEEKYICSTEGHISHILSSRLSSRPMGWSMIGADEMARMRTFRENGGSISKYYNALRTNTKNDSRIRRIDQKTIQKHKKQCFGSFNPDTMIEMSNLAIPEFKWLKNISRYATS